MFEIGSALRQARERQGLSLQDVESATRMRARQLAALEEERFDLFPGDFYARTFLRGYADFLGLDGRLFVTEYDERFEREEETAAPSRPRLHLPPRRAAFAAGVLAAVAAAVLLAWSSGGGHRAAPLAAAPAPRPVVRVVPHTPPRRRAAPRPRPFRVVLHAARGNCWLLVRAGSEAGPLLYEGTLAEGKTLVFARRFLWFRAGAPANLEVRVAGKSAPVASTGIPLNLLVTPKGLRPA